jgi:peptidoglycan/LPS O-acetylase OafA/YrhL
MIASIWFTYDEVISPVWTSFPMLWVDWILGAYLAEAFLTGRRVFQAWWCLPATFMLFVLAGLWKPTNCLSFTLASVCWAILLERAVHVPWDGAIIRRWLAHMGVISYSIYLWHDPILEMLHLKLQARQWAVPTSVFAVGAFLLVDLLSRLSYQLLEVRPWGRLRLANTDKQVPLESTHRRSMWPAWVCRFRVKSNTPKPD